VGRVIRVGPTTSEVLLLIDRTSAVVSRVVPSGETGLLEGDGSEVARLELFNPDAALAVGDRVVTSGYDKGLYPPGIPVGTVVGAKPELLLLMVVAVGMSEGPAFGATAGFVMGLSTDLVLQLPAGVSALTFTVIGYVVGRMRAQVQAPGAWLPMAMVSIATFLGVLFYAAFNRVLGEQFGAFSVL